MSSTSNKFNPPFPVTADIPWSTEPPTQPEAYWFQRESTSRMMLLEVRVTDGALTVRWPIEDQPVAKLQGGWRGPIPPSSQRDHGAGRESQGKSQRRR